jgi:hypothetical protein
MEVTMWLVIVGGVLVGIVGIGAIFDLVARRHGRSSSFGGNTGSPTITAQTEHNSTII